MQDNNTDKTKNAEEFKGLSVRKEYGPNVPVLEESDEPHRELHNRLVLRKEREAVETRISQGFWK